MAFPKGAVKKVLASLEKCWQSQKELLKNVGKLSNVLEFAEGAFEKVLANLELCWHSQGELLTLKATDEYSHLIAISVVRPGYATTPHPIFPIGQATKKPANRRVAGEGEGGKMMQYCA